ncbi:CPBP family intramembrane glutamic endopeptidase [Pseudonocardia spinosispora]|uniref:CPBP family intramembrane glutamic endopeptidase n=1 Tax=Pseudonocardia spinosispora TaxID=103441 RepID=UPI0004137315|nr:CPBP family intramembrane glutamic endopeptidase [Pseudonocardia spinosispora]
MSTAGPPEAAREPREPWPAAAGVADIAGPSALGTVDKASPPHRWGFGAYLLAETVFLGASVLLVWPYLGGDKNAIPPLVLLLGLLVPTLLAAAVAVIATVVRGNGPRLDLRLQFDRKDIGQGVLLGCFGLLFTIPAAALWARVVGPEKANSAVGEMFAGHRFGVAMAIAVFLSVWLIAPICEEIVYRGLLWGAMERHGAARWWAFGLTTLCFALAHFEFSRTPLLLVIAVPIGLARLYTGRLGASIIAHQLNNLLPAVSLLLVMLGVVT